MSATVLTQAVTAERLSTLKTYRAAELSTAQLLALTARPRIDFSSILDTVRLNVHAGAISFSSCSKKNVGGRHGHA
jgi:hypothetical protein